MDLQDKIVEITGNDKTLINRILGEMKNQFNKTDKKQVPIMLNFAASKDETFKNEDGNLDSEMSSVNNTHTSSINYNVKSPIVKTEVDICDIAVNGIEEIPSNVEVKNELDAIKIDIESKTGDEPLNLENEILPVKEEINPQDDNDEKPRIVLTFRKPSVNDVSKARNKNDGTSGAARRTLRAKLQILDEKVILKRSPRRRSRDYNESVLQNAIARKEKSYNEASKPQRLTRQLKATPKILENLANAALKLEKVRPEKNKVSKADKHKLDDSDNSINSEENLGQSESELENDKNCKKPKQKLNKNFKYNAKRVKSNQFESPKDSESDESMNLELKESETKLNCSIENKNKNNKNRSSLDEKPCRRSHRLFSKLRDEFVNVDESTELLEPSTAEQNSFYPADPESSSVETKLASQLCLCTHKTHIYVSAIENDIMYCTAIDSIGDRLIGCSNIINGNEITMLRPSTRVPYTILCEVHLNRMFRHNCCPRCGLFCTQGRFAQCDAKHQYHRDCQITVGDTACCPHCGIVTPDYDVFVAMRLSKKPIFLPTQKLCPSAKMSFQIKSKKTDKIIEENRISLPIIAPDCITPIVVQNLQKPEKYTINDLFLSIKENNYERIANILYSHSVEINTTLEEIEGGTVLHYAAQNGLLSILHMLIIASSELDVLDKEQNTALMCAILAFKNSVVKYLIKAGASIVLKGTDGMTALHLAAKSGNLEACELLLNAAHGIQNYVNMADDGGWTPLVWACEHAHFEIAKFLLYKSADPSLRDVEQNVALHWAAFSGSSDIIELLLNNKSNINVVNAHGDSPLHIAARQNVYNCILILLTRGANVNVVNKAGETPLDCSRPMGDCYNAIFLNVQLQEVTTSDERSSRTILTNDISKGREKNPIQCINTIDEEDKPSNFTYISINYVSSDVIIDCKISSMHFCKCEEKCLSFACLCCNNSLRCWYNEEKRLVSDFNYSDPPLLFECNQLCSCNIITCNNRVVQQGVTQRFQLYKTETKGWAIRTLRNINKGSFVCEYIGEIISDVEAERRKDDNFLFVLDSQGYDSFSIDAKYYGNFTRFINHSCDPNLVPIRVFVEHHDLRFPKIAFFANKDIAAEEELSFDYGEKFWFVKCRSFTCNCGSFNCRYSEDTIEVTLENYTKSFQKPIK